MHRSFVTVVLAAMAVSPAMSAPPDAPMPMQGGQMQGGAVMVHDAWARASPGAAANGAAYVTLMGGAQPDALIGASTPVAATAEVHESTTEGGVMRMRAVASVKIPAGKTVSLAPGGYHIMLFDLKHPLKAGETFPVTLTFEHAAPVTVDVQVRAVGTPAAMGGTDGHDHMQMK